MLRLLQTMQMRHIRVGKPLIAFLLGATLIYDVVRVGRVDRGFQRDHRRELVDWIKANVPADGAIAVEERVGIPYGKPSRFCEEPKPVPQRLRGARFTADLGTLEELRADEITHVAVTAGHYHPFFRKEEGARRGVDETFRRRRLFYQRLFAEGRLVWERKSGNVGVLNPDLRLYEIGQPAAAAAP